MKRLVNLIFLLLFFPALAAAQSCPSSITTVGGAISCWVPPAAGTTIADLIDSNPLTIASDSTYALQSGNTIGCGTGSSPTPGNVGSGCDLTSAVSYSPSSATVVMKFAGTGGPLAQFGGTSSINALYQYFELYLDSFGRLTWGTYNYGALNVLQSGSPDRPRVFADGNPHIVVASIGANGMKLYADGDLIGTQNVTLANYAQGLWLFGQAGLSSAGPTGNAWPNASPQFWFNGTIYYAAWWNSQLTDAQAKTLSNPGTNPLAPVTNNYVTLTGTVASLAQSGGYSYANAAVKFVTTATQLPACSSTTPIAPSSQTYYTDGSGNLPASLQLQQGAHVTMVIGPSSTPLIMPCQSTVSLATLLPAQTPLPDAVSSVVLAGPLYQGTTVANPAVGQVGPATLTSPATVNQPGSGTTVTVDRNLGPQQSVTLTASTAITFTNLLDGAPQLIVDVIEGAPGGFTPTFAAPTGFTLTWPGGLGQPAQPSTASGQHTFYGFLVEGTTIFGSITAANTGTGTFPLTATANFANFSGTSVNDLTLNALIAPTPSITVTCTGTCTTNYTYELVCLGDNSTHSTVSSTISGLNNATLNGLNFNTISWTLGTGCYGGYQIYGRIAGSLGLIGTVSSTTASFIDNSLAAPGASPPLSGTTGTLTASAVVGNTVSGSVNGVINITSKPYNAIGDMRSGTDGVTASNTTFTSASLNCNSLVDPGKTIVINGANGVPAGTTISSCTNPTTAVLSAAATGTGTGLSWWMGTNNATAIVNAVKAACPNSLCTSQVYSPTGRYLVSYTGTGAALSLNTSLFGGVCSMPNLHLVGAGGLLGGASNVSPGLSQWMISANAAQVGISMIGDVGLVVEHMDIENPTTATGPKALIMTGKAGSCDATLGAFNDDMLYSNAGVNTFVYYSYGLENVSFNDTQVRSFAIGGVAAGNALGFTSTNATYAIVPGDVALRAAPVSMSTQSFRGKAGVIGVGGTNASLDYGVFLEEGANNNLIRDYDFDTYWQSNNATATCNDVMVGDGLAATIFTYPRMRFNGLFEALCLTNQQQFIKIGRAALSWDVSVFGGANAVNPFINPLSGATNSNFNLVVGSTANAFSSGAVLDQSTTIWLVAGATYTAPQAIVYGHSDGLEQGFAHGQQLFTANGTFTVPNGVTSVTFEAWGAGGGGGGFGTSATTGGGGGGSTVANAGVGATVLTASGGGGGQGVTSGLATVISPGGTPSNGLFQLGGGAGVADFGSAAPRGGASTLGTNVGNAPGGGGGGGFSTLYSTGGGGGGAGAYAMNQVTTKPGATFTVVVGTAGTAGTGATANGGAGAQGEVLVTW